MCCINKINKVFACLIILFGGQFSYSQNTLSYTVADSLKMRGLDLYASGQYNDAIVTFEHAANIYNSISENNPSYAICLNNIGACYSNLGDYAKALDYHQQVLAIREIIFGKNHHQYATSLNNIGLCFQNLGNNTKALEYYLNALAVLDNINSKDNPDYAWTLDGIGGCYISFNEYTNALMYYQRALEVNEKLYGNEHPNIAWSLYNTGICYYILGAYNEALAYLERALTIFEKAFGKEHSGYIRSLNIIGRCYSTLGNYQKALENHQQAMVILESTYSKKHPDFLSSLEGIGTCYLSIGDYSKALDYYQYAQSILDNEQPLYASNLNNIGLCYFELGDYSKALDYHKRSLEIIEKVEGKGHPDYAWSLNSIGKCYYLVGDYKRALEYYSLALAVCKSIFGENHPDYASYLSNIATCYRFLGNYLKALEFNIQALAIFKMVYGESHPLYAKSLNNIGMCYFNLLDYTKALEYHRHAFEIRATIYGQNHPESAESLKNMGACYAIIGDYPNAVDYYLNYFSSVTHLVTNTFSTLTEPQRLLFWNKFEVFFTNNLFGICTYIPTPEMNCVAYNSSLFGKGLLLNAETEMRKLILESGNSDALEIYNHLNNERIQLDKIYQDSIGKKAIIDSLNDEINRHHQALIKLSKVYGDFTSNLALKWKDVQNSLGKREIAIEFETYTKNDTTFYIALTLKRGYSEPHLVELFNSFDLAKINPKHYYKSFTMTELIWGKLNDELNGMKNVYFSPVGELNSIAIEYLIDKDDVHLISDKRNYYRLTSTREIVKKHAFRKIVDATIYGGIRYDITPKSQLTGDEPESYILTQRASRVYTSLDSLSTTRGGVTWKFLNASQTEAEEISATLTAAKIRNELLEGEKGTEDSFKALSGGNKSLIHIATHGFYWAEATVLRSGITNAAFLLGEEHEATKEDKMLTRSGLLFAGAQNTFDGRKIPIDVEDGILTAKEISRLDLRGTDLVVLSACQSGLGEVTGDGVFGLQRGFKKAGAHSIVMSLWSVNDEATRIMMTRFYMNLVKGRNKYVAFREAQEYLRKYKGGLYNNPNYYAAFVILDAIN